MQEDGQLPGRPHELLPLLLVPLKLKGDCCNVAVLNASAACMGLSQRLPAGAEEIVAADSHVTRILNAHVGLPVWILSVISCREEMLSSVMCLTDALWCTSGSTIAGLCL